MTRISCFMALAAGLLAAWSGCLAAGTARAADPAGPAVSRPHPRLKEEKPAGRREKLEIGTLFIPAALERAEKVPLFVHFHGGTWLPEVVAARDGRAAVITVQLGSGSRVYGQAFADPRSFGQLLQEAERRAGMRFEPVGLTAWSAGYGAVRQILRAPGNADRIAFVILLDGLHAGYQAGKPEGQPPALVAEDLAVFVPLAREAVAGKKQFIVTHSEIVPGTYASTTETADYLLKQLDLRRQARPRPGPLGMQQLSEVRRGQFRLIGFAGNSAPDHVDHLHALPEFLKWIDWRPRPVP